MLLRMATNLLFLLLPIHAEAAALMSPDLQLIALVPPESKVIAGLHSPTSRNQPDSLLLITRENRIDYEDFFALTGADTSRRFHQVVFVAEDGRRGWLSDHTLLVSGHFDRDTIFRFAYEGKASIVSYEGIAMLAIPAFARELSTFKEARWLAILDSNLAVFGSIASVQHVIDRYLSKSAADPLILDRIRRLGQTLDAWCLLPPPGPGIAIPPVLEKLDPKLGEVTRRGVSMQYGFHFGGRVEIVASINATPQTNRLAQSDEPAGESPAAFHLLNPSNHGGPEDGESIVVKVKLDLYLKWLTENSNVHLAKNSASR